MTKTPNPEAYSNGYACGSYGRENRDTYDPRWDFADAAKAGTFEEFKRGFADGYEGKEEAP